MKETGLTGKGRSTTIAATPDDGKSQRKRRYTCYVSILVHSFMQFIVVVALFISLAPLRIYPINFGTGDLRHSSKK